MSATGVRPGTWRRVPMSYGDYVALGETHSAEYVDGCAVMNPPTRQHVRVARRLARLLEDAVAPGYEVLPEAGWQVEQQVLVPDLMVAAVDAPGPDLLREAPLLVVEVTSPSTRSYTWQRKRELYGEGGAPWYWIVDPAAREVAVLRASSGELDVVERIRARRVVTEPFAVELDVPALVATPGERG